MPDEPFGDELDPAASERERRRAEREAARSARARGEAPLPRRHRAPKLSERTKLSESAEIARDRLELRQRRTPKRPRRGFAAIAIVVAIGAIIGAFLLALFQPFAGDGLGEGACSVTIPRGSSASEVADILDDGGVVSSGFLMQVRMTLSGGREDLQAGRHDLGCGMSYKAAIAAVQEPPAPPKTVSATIPEGLTRSEIAPVVKDAGLEGDYEKATTDAGDYGFNLAEYEAQDADSLEGFLFPATYDLPRDARVEDLVERQLKAFEENAAGVDFSTAADRDLTPYDVLIIASLVEREAQLDDERPLIAAVIYNRLEQGEPLGIDATIRFALDNWTEPLLSSDLEIDSPYNTYNNQGLPPGPIGNPGLASIEAAANPADVDYLFYVVKPGTCGEHNFATTLEEHNANVAEYEEARDEAGGESPDTC